MITPEVLIVTTDKKTYTDSELVTVSGMVSAIGDPTILVGIYDQNEFPTGFYTPQITADLEFSVSFLAKGGINFKTPGTYFVKAHYGDSKETAIFEFVNLAPPPKKQDSHPIAKPQPTKPPPTKQQTQAKQETKIQTAEPEPQVPKSEPVPKKESIQKQDNLSVEDQELGKMLNEITLNCDYSEYDDSIVYHDAMGPALMRLCNYEQAISYFDEALIKNPDDAGIITNKATAYGRLGQLDVAIAYYDEALKIDPNYAPALNNKANALAQLGKFEDAISIYTAVLDDDPSYTVSQNNLQKTKEKFVQYTNSKQKVQETVTNISVDDEQTVIDIDHDSQAGEPKSFIDQIGNIFASFFGFLS